MLSFYYVLFTRSRTKLSGRNLEKKNYFHCDRLSISQHNHLSSLSVKSNFNSGPHLTFYKLDLLKASWVEKFLQLKEELEQKKSKIKSLKLLSTFLTLKIMEIDQKYVKNYKIRY